MPCLPSSYAFRQVHQGTVKIHYPSCPFYAMWHIMHKTNTVAVTTKFIFNAIIICFGCLVEFVSAQGGNFFNDVITHIMKNFVIKQCTSTPYYPQGNELSKCYLYLWVKTTRIGMNAFPQPYGPTALPIKLQWVLSHLNLFTVPTTFTIQIH